MTFFLKMNPPTITAQEHKVSVVNGKPVFYQDERLRDTRDKFMWLLSDVKGRVRLDGAVELYCLWLFPKGRHRDGEWRTTKPDTDNLQKLLKDCMTDVGFWKDDAQVAREVVEKRWSAEPCGIYVSVKALDGGGAYGKS